MAGCCALADTVPSLLAAERWAPGIGDPTPMGWITVALYACAAWLAFEAALRARSLADVSGRPGWRVEAARRARLGRFWFAVAAFLVLLGLNKQLDLQRLVTQIGRDIARDGGWYRDRKPVQIAVAVGALALGVVGTGVAAWMLRDIIARVWVALVGLLVLFVFIAARVNSLHQIDAWMRAGPIPAKWWLELLGIALIGANAWRAWRGRPASGVA
ncbi:MAG: hypothetical protein ACKOYN_06945 [Planctomycetota bacterium]